MDPSSVQRSETTSAPDPVPNTSTWRTRDAARDLLQRHGQSSASFKGPPKPSMMQYSTVWDEDTCMARLRRDKASVVRAAFDAAAMLVLRALDGSTENDGQSVLTASSLRHTSSPPFSVVGWNYLQELREAGLSTAHLHKEHAGQPSVAKDKTSKSTKPSQAEETDTASKMKSKPSVKSGSSKFSTPEAAAIDSRSTFSHAVVCAAASIAFSQLTPNYPGHEVDVKNIPQNSYQGRGSPDGNDENEKPSLSSSVNMGAVLFEAQKFGQRIVSLAENAARRSSLRYDFRRSNAKNANEHDFSWIIRRFLGRGRNEASEVDGEITPHEEATFTLPPQPTESHLTPQWKSQCAPRFLSVLGTGPGHAIYYDVEWSSRHKRIGDLLKRLQNNRHGPHLIVTTQPEEEAFAQEFASVDSHVLTSSSPGNYQELRVLRYDGSQTHRRKLRERFSSVAGLPESSFHVILTSYAVLLQDYVHLCQVPYQVALLDDGVSWLSAAYTDPSGIFGTMWDSAVWSTSDENVGLAGTGHKKWDFTSSDPQIKEALIGLTARHRVLTTSCMSHKYRESLVTAPIPALLKFVIPHFTQVVKEEWDRSKITQDATSMSHMRKLLSRSIVVHYPGGQHDMQSLAVDALTGNLPAGDRSSMLLAPEIIPEEVLVSEGKVSYSRRVSIQQWFQPVARSWLFYELGKASYTPILDAMKDSNLHGHICEEVVTASSMTTSGAGGVVTGSMAYRLGVRCGRKFGSEQGLRQHMAGMHAPPGTWLCRTCGEDCGTSQTRTHHERSCGQPTVGGDQGSGATPTVGQGVKSKVPSGPSKKVTKKVPKGLGSKTEVKANDGSFRVPGYQGVWIDASGKHFFKLDDERMSRGGEKPDAAVRFESADEAARAYDEMLLSRGADASSVDLNYTLDGIRIVYEVKTPAATTGRGLDLVGGASNDVVPALSVINIKDLPKDVKPLLRDPRQTSRTGGNSKRHVYAYRGVCRQARKGHDRWQSQISFNGQNHYLGTFDSEWDAAAVYAWAHLILYGEEATKQAQKEGEEAAAAYEREKQDIVDGKALPLPTSQKKKPEKKPLDDGQGAALMEPGKHVNSTPGEDGGELKKRKKQPKSSSSAAKKVKMSSPKMGSRADLLNMAALLSKAVVKVPALEPRRAYASMSDGTIIQTVGERVMAGRALRSSVMVLGMSTPAHPDLRSCVPIKSTSLEGIQAGAILLGVSSRLFGWNFEAFLSACSLKSDTQRTMASLTLSEEYGANGYNESFRSALCGETCVVGQANRITEEACRSLHLDLPLGCTVGGIDCHIGGTTGSCSESAATIQFCPSGGGEFQFCANNGLDIVTLNGQRIQMGTGGFPLLHGDVCTVGCRVFVFLLPNDS